MKARCWETVVTRSLQIALLATAAMLSSAASAADVFGFNAEKIGRPGVDPPWHGKSKYVFVAPNPNPRTSITVDAFDLDGYAPTCPPVLLKGETSNTVIGVGTDCNPYPKAWLNEGYGIFLGQPAVSVEITLKDISTSRDVLWEVFGVDASGKPVFFQGTFRGRGHDDTVNQSWMIDQNSLATTQVQPPGGFARPVGINAVNIKSLGTGATLPAFGATRLDQSIYLVAVTATGF
jgi:hypothetical protein